MYNIYKRESCDADTLVDSVATEDEAKEILEFWKHLIKDDPYNDEEEAGLYYVEVAMQTVAVVTTRLDRHYGKRNEAWFVRHDAIKRFFPR